MKTTLIKISAPTKSRTSYGNYNVEFIIKYANGFTTNKHNFFMKKKEAMLFYIKHKNKIGKRIA